MKREDARSSSTKDPNSKPVDVAEDLTVSGTLVGSIPELTTPDDHEATGTWCSGTRIRGERLRAGSERVEVDGEAEGVLDRVLAERVVHEAQP